MTDDCRAAFERFYSPNAPWDGTPQLSAQDAYMGERGVLWRAAYTAGRASREEEIEKLNKYIVDDRDAAIQALTAKLEVAREALNFYAAGENVYIDKGYGLVEGKMGPPLGYRAREAIKRLWDDKNG